MATTMSANVFPDFLHCKLCKEVYTNPKILPCFHSFCSECLGDHLQKHNEATSVDPRISCPICNNATTVGTSGIDGFEDNLFLMKLLDIFKGDVQSCSKDGTEVLHTTHSHPVVCKEQQDTSAKLFCTTCKTVLCNACDNSTHRQHQTVDLLTAAKAEREVMTDQFDYIRHKMEIVFAEVVQVDADLSQLDTTRIKQMAALLKQKEELIAQINMHYESESEKVHEAIDGKKIVIEKLKRMRKNYIGSIEEFFTMWDALIRSGSDADIMSISSYIEQHIKRLEGHQVPDIPLKTYLEISTSDVEQLNTNDLCGKVITGVQQPDEKPTKVEDEPETLGKKNHPFDRLVLWRGVICAIVVICVYFFYFHDYSLDQKKTVVILDCNTFEGQEPALQALVGKDVKIHVVTLHIRNMVMWKMDDAQQKIDLSKSIRSMVGDQKIRHIVIHWNLYWEHTYMKDCPSAKWMKAIDGMYGKGVGLWSTYIQWGMGGVSSLDYAKAKIGMKQRARRSGWRMISYWEPGLLKGGVHTTPQGVVDSQIKMVAKGIQNLIHPKHDEL